MYVINGSVFIQACASALTMLSLSHCCTCYTVLMAAHAEILPELLTAAAVYLTCRAAVRDVDAKLSLLRPAQAFSCVPRSVCGSVSGASLKADKLAGNNVQ